MRSFFKLFRKSEQAVREPSTTSTYNKFFTDSVAMVRPTSFYSNVETAKDNKFQAVDAQEDKETTTRLAQ